MNERLQELYREAVQSTNSDEHLDMPNKQVQRLILTKYAELVTAEAVAREREACAQLCDDAGRVAPVTENEILHKQCYKLADLIRARTYK
jgi:hypothetical protein